MLKIIPVVALLLTAPVAAFAQAAPQQPSADAQMFAVASAAQETANLRAQLYDMSKQTTALQAQVAALQAQLSAAKKPPVK